MCEVMLLMHTSRLLCVYCFYCLFLFDSMVFWYRNFDTWILYTIRYFMRVCVWVLHHQPPASHYRFFKWLRIDVLFIHWTQSSVTNPMLRYCNNMHCINIITFTLKSACCFVLPSSFSWSTWFSTRALSHPHHSQLKKLQHTLTLAHQTIMTISENHIICSSTLTQLFMWLLLNKQYHIHFVF